MAHARPSPATTTYNRLPNDFAQSISHLLFAPHRAQTAFLTIATAIYSGYAWPYAPLWLDFFLAVTLLSEPIYPPVFVN